MGYSLPIYSNYCILEPRPFYEINLVNQWLKILPGTVLNSLSNGRITVINVGKFNKHEGPDVKDAILLINDKIKFGPIECHKTPSDWYHHNHQKNPNYDNVILHVVNRMGNSANAPQIPTVVLISDDTIRDNCTLNVVNKNINISKIILQNSSKRWLTKVSAYDGFHSTPSEVIKQLILNSFMLLGSGGNKKTFGDLALAVDLDKLQTSDTNQIENYLSNIMVQLIWVKRGIRPAHQPQNRRRLAAELISYIKNIKVNHFTKISNLDSDLLKKCPSTSGMGIRTELLGNVFIPFYAARALYHNKIDYYHEYFENWMNLKLPYIYNKFSKKFGSILSTKELKLFSNLQGLIEIENNWCKTNKCHLCTMKEKKYANR